MIQPSPVVLVTGSAGFIGMHVAIQAARAGYTVLGLDDLNDYYSVDLKLARLRQQGIETDEISTKKVIWGNQNIGFVKGGIEDKGFVDWIFETNNIIRVVHLAAQGGVRYSRHNPDVFVKSNVVGFFNILQACSDNKVEHLVYASSSSVYGGTEVIPFKESDNVDHPISLYAATKKSNELMAHTYSHLFGLPTTGLRFFTVYGPWGRPDMAIYKFTERIIAGKPIDVYNNGKMSRDFTYIDDIVEGVLRVLETVPGPLEIEGNKNEKEKSKPPYRICNIGRNEPVRLNAFIECIEKATGKKAICNNLPMQPGDVKATFADVTELKSLIGYIPKMDVEEGIQRFVTWYKDYHGA